MGYFFPDIFKPKIVRMWPASGKNIKKGNNRERRQILFSKRKKKRKRERNSGSVKYRNKVSE